MNNQYKQIELMPVVETVAEEALRLLSVIPENEWHVGSYDSECGTKHCGARHLDLSSKGYGHFVRLFKAINKKLLNDNRFAQVNDGEAPEYQQSTPKQRVIALLTDMVKAGY